MTALPPLVVDAPTPEETFVVGRGYKARVSSKGLEFAALPGPALPLEPLRTALQRVQVGKLALPLETHKLADEGHACTLEHGSLRERFELRQDGVEQSFHFAALPARGELTVRLAVDTRLDVSGWQDGLCFGDGLHTLHYGGSLVLDAVGKRLACPSRWVDGAVQITVPEAFVASAVLPLVIDPLLWAPKTWVLGTGTGANLSVQTPDLAYSEATASWLLVWRVQAAANDGDIYARRFDRNWLHLGSAQSVDVSTVDSTSPKVAWVAGAGQWHIVALQQLPTLLRPVGLALRRWNTWGAVGAKLTLAEGSPFEISSRVAIGGDTATSSPGVSLVVWRSDAFNVTSAAKYRLVGADGSMTVARTLPTGTSVESVAVSKSNGATRWLVGWCERVLSTGLTREVRGVFLDRVGNVVPPASGPTLLFASFPLTVADSADHVSVGSPDLSGIHTVCYLESGSSRLRRVPRTGSITPPVSLDVLAAGWGAGKTVVETDGTRVLALRNDGNSLRAVHLAYDARPGAWRALDDFLVPALLPVNSVVVSSRFVGGASALASPFTLGCGAADSALSVVRVVDYQFSASGGPAPGNGYERIASACGKGLAIEHGATLPTPGSTLRFALATRALSAGFLVGAPADVPLTGICACTVRAAGAVIPRSRIEVPIPADPNLVGVAIAVQGFACDAGPCLGHVSLSDTIRVEVR